MPEELRGIPFDANEIILPDGNLGYDNVLYAEDFANWMKTYFKNGVLVPGGAMITTEMQVTEISETSVQVDVGNMVVNGRTTFIEEPILVTINKAGPDTERWDRVVVELNIEEAVNSFRLLVVTGEMSASPSAPELVRTDTVYQMSLATVKANQSGIYEIVDDRGTDALCGISQVLIGVRAPLPVTGDTADNISYDNSTSGLTGQTVQAAIDEIAEGVNASAENVTYSNSSSGLTATNVQAAIDEVVEDVEEKAPMYTYGTEDLTAGSSSLETGKLYLVYE